MAMVNKKEVPFKRNFTKDELEAVHEIHAALSRVWLFYQSAYDGIEALLKNDFICKHPRESEENWKKRKEDLFSFDYSQAIVDLFNFYQHKDPTVIMVPDKLKTDAQWLEFQDDANLYGDSFAEVWKEYSRKASISGHIGILVDKSSKTFANKQEEKDANVYPYLCSYQPNAILDWAYEKDENNRPYLSYLKLLDDNNQYRIWYPDQWEIWEVKENEDESGDYLVEMIASGINALGIIPFIWLYNVKSTRRFIGTSDIKSISRIDLSIIRNLSQGEEVIEYAAFPMMRKPMREKSVGEPKEDVVGPKAVLEFDPEYAEYGKPDWLEAKVGEAIDAILQWLERKVQEIYRSSNAGGMASTEIQTQAKSGVALKTEFQLLNAKLVDKGISNQKAQKKAIEYWLMWQDVEELNEEVEVNVPKSYDIDNLAEDLQNVLTSKTIVKSKTFHIKLQKDVVRDMYPYLDHDEYEEIDKEIEDNTPDPIVLEQEDITGGGNNDNVDEDEDENQE